MPILRRIAALSALVLLGASHPALAQEPDTPELRAVRTTHPPTLDGVLDDEVWLGSPLALGSWASYNPLRGEAAQQQTDVWVAYDQEAIYFAFRCHDTEPDKIRTTITRRDNSWSDDWVGLSLDSSRAGQLAYHLFVNPSGMQMDGLQSGSNGEDMAPDWVWQSAARVGSDGWTAEIRLPLEVLRFASGRDVKMGVLFWRRISRSGVSTSSPAMAPGHWVFESHAPLVFDELHQPLLLEVIPSATFSSNQTRLDSGGWDPTRARGDFGASVKYGITSSVTLDATVNPDFSQVESDAFEVEVNQRFPVFFSEKRPFFMEGMGLFNLAGTGGDATMRTAVHTRTIIDPAAGVKITGSEGRHSFGVLSAADASPIGDKPRAFVIGREVMNFGRGQYVGVLATNTQWHSEYNRVLGGDFVARRGETFRVNGSFLSSFTRSIDGKPANGIGSQASYSYNTRRVSLSAQLEHYDKGFRMDTAFINRVGITRGWQYAEVQFYPDRPSYLWIKRIAPFFWMARANDRNQGGSEQWIQPGIRFNFTRAGYLRIDRGRGHETYAGQEFEVGRFLVDAGAQFTKWLNLNGSINRGPSIYYDPAEPFQGDKSSLSLRTTLQPSSKFTQTASYSLVTFHRRSTGLLVYRVHVTNLRTTYQFSPRFFVRGVVQSDSSQTKVLTDFLASYELSPGTVAHAGYGSLFGEDEVRDGYRATRRALFFKASYLVRF